MKSNQPEKSSNHQPNKQSFNKYVKFSALAFQWIGLFVMLSLGGNWLDTHFQHHFPSLTLTGVFLSLFIIFYSLYKLVTQSNND